MLLLVLLIKKAIYRWNIFDKTVNLSYGPQTDKTLHTLNRPYFSSVDVLYMLEFGMS